MSIRRSATLRLTNFATAAPLVVTDGFETPDHAGIPAMLQLFVQGGTSVTATIYQWDDNLSGSNKWVAIETAIVTTTGTQALIRAASNTRYFVRPTGEAGGATSLLVSIITGNP